MNTPDSDTVLRVIAGLISTEHPIAPPGEPGGYGAQQLMRAPMMLLAIAEEFDRAAHWRAQENQALRQLFGQVAATIADDTLRERLIGESSLADTDLRVSSLEKSNRQLRGLLVELHAFVQAAGGSQMAAIEERIWQELKAGTERRRSPLDRF